MRPRLALVLEFLLNALFTLDFAFWRATLLALDGLEIGRARRIPLCLFGFLY